MEIGMNGGVFEAGQGPEVAVEPYVEWMDGIYSSMEVQIPQCLGLRHFPDLPFQYQFYQFMTGCPANQFPPLSHYFTDHPQHSQIAASTEYGSMPSCTAV